MLLQKKNIEKIKYDKKEKKERERKMKIYGDRKRKGSPLDSDLNDVVGLFNYKDHKKGRKIISD